MTTLLDLARAVQEACAKKCCAIYENASDADGEQALDCEASIRSLDLSSLLAQFDDVVVVPREPTEAMMNAADKALWKQMKSSVPSDHNDRPICKAIYAAMLAAAQEQRHD